MKRLLLAAGVLAVGALTTAGVLATNDHPERTAPGTTVSALDLAGLERTALQQRLVEEVGRNPDRVVVHLGTRRAVVPTDRLGIAVDVDATVDRVLAESGTGRRWGLLPGGRGRAVGPVLVVDEDQLAATVARLVATGDRAPSDGALRWDGRAMRAVPPAAGQDVTEQAVRTALQGVATRIPLAGDVVVPVTAVPASVTPAAVEAVAAEARALLAAPPVLRAGTQTARVRTADLGPLLRLAVTDGQARLELEERATDALAGRLAEELSVAPVEPRVAAPVPRPLLETKGSATWDPVPATVTLEAEGKPGRTVTPLDVRLALQRLRGGLLTVATQVALPRTSADGVQHIDSVLGTFTTHFQCCQPRVRNITLMARTLDQTLVPAGGSFSINDIVGERTTAKGYVDAPYIFEGELSTDIGGGVSQVGTTTLNAAFFAGLRLDEHKAHSFYISRYPTGREATLNYPDLDVRWTNTTSSPVFVRTKVTSTSLTVTVYGHDDGRTVEGITGERRPVPGRDFRVRIDRLVRFPDGTVRRDGFTTTYNKPPEGH